MPIKSVSFPNYKSEYFTNRFIKGKFSTRRNKLFYITELLFINTKWRLDRKSYFTIISVSFNRQIKKTTDKIFAPNATSSGPYST